MTRKRRWLLVALGVVAVVAPGLLVTAVFAAKPLARSIVVEAARAHGVALDPLHVDLGWGWIRLREAQLGLDGVPGLSAKVERATVDLSAFTPSRVELRGLSVNMTCSSADFVIDLGAWARRYGDALTFPVAADGVRVTWRESATAPPWLQLEKGLVMPAPGGAKFTAERAVVLGTGVGPVGAVWALDQASITFGFGEADPAAALARMDLNRDTGKARVTLGPVALSALEEPLGVKMPIDGKVVVEGTAEFSLPLGQEPSEVEGTLHAKLRGYVPPHPRELEGIVFGDVTTFDTSFRLSPNRRRLWFEKSRVTAGAFVLDGGGTVDREEDHGKILMNMAGNIPCTALAKTAAVAHLGAQFGRLIGDVAKLALAGSVRVAVKIHADTRKLGEAKVTHDVGIGCTLRLP